MGQVTIYLEDNIEKKIKRAAKKSGASLSKWLAQLIRKEIDASWPQTISEMAGTWHDFPDLDELRAKHGRDYPRERL